MISKTKIFSAFTIILSLLLFGSVQGSADTKAVPGYPQSSFHPNTTTNTYFSGSGSTTVFGNTWHKVSNTTVYPYSATAWVVAYFPNVPGKGAEYSYGSAFFISPYNLLTAGHVLYNKNLGGYPAWIKVYPANNGSFAPYGYFTPKSYVANPSYVNSAASYAESSTYSPVNDVGVITLSSGIGRVTGFYGVSTSPFVGQGISVNGYPAAKFTNTSQGLGYGNLFTGNGTITAKGSDTVSYNADMLPGDSGGVVSNTSNQAVAVNTAQNSKTNIGTQLSGAKWNFVAPYTRYNPYSEVFRLYNPYSGEHFYTISSFERDNLIKAGWRFEGVDWFAPVSSAIPIFRLYNPNSGDHFYTTGSYERDSLVKAGWRYEGVSFYSDPSNGTPVYRLYNPNAKVGQHFYTISSAERDGLVRAGWKYEGVSWYGLN